MNENDFLKKIGEYPVFIERFNQRTNTDKEKIISLTMLMHNAGLDTYITNDTDAKALMFGQKEIGNHRAERVFIRIRGIVDKIIIVCHFDKNSEIPYDDFIRYYLPELDKLIQNRNINRRLNQKAYWPCDYNNEDAEPEPARRRGRGPREPDDVVRPHGLVIDDEIEGESEPENEPKSERPAENVIYYGPPGTGKTFEIQKILDNEYTDEEYTDKELRQRYEFVTFHQSYGYEEFVEGLRPVIDESNRDEHLEDSTGSNTSGQVRYEIKPGAFLRLCERARKNPSQRFAMVIDEINRGNVSKIFGELITLVELDKRAGTENAISVTLPYSGKNFSVPMNVDVIGTMNTADRSLALVDTALRRRFEFIESMPKPLTLEGVVVSKGGKNINIKKLLTTINKRIEALYNRDHTIGHAYFTHLKKLDEEERFSELKKIFQYKIIPLLEEYFFEDWQKIRLVLGDNQKRNKDQQFVQEIGRGDDLVELFGRDHGLNQHAIRSRYQLNVDALDSLGAYIGIYDPTDL
jgi:MoxR-like ATPase